VTKRDARSRRAIYVESLIRAPIDRVWAATQEPEQHQRWDVRFGRITYLDHVDGEAQHFTYATTVAPGVTIAGTGESLGDRERPDGTRWSGLRFWAADRRSIIKSGAGYWRYIPTDDGVRFLTRYDYQPRWGHFGSLVDKAMFRRLFGWATAWSFDRLRLWLEDDVPPEQSRDRAITHATAVAGLVAVFAYQGLVPKLWKVDSAEVGIWRDLGLSHDLARHVVRAVGAVEAGFAVATVLRSDKRWPFVVAIAAMPTLAIGAAKANRSILTRAFNPASLGVAVVALGGIALTTRSGRPSGRHPRRHAPDRQPDVGELP
jgi:hypothetical protein